MEKSSSKKKWLTIAAVSILVTVIVLIVVVILLQPKKSRKTVKLGGGLTPTLTTGGHLTASNQPSGKTVTVTSVTLSQPGYVIIHQEKQKNPDKVIGKSDLLPIGTAANITITLDRRSKTGETLFAILHNDDGNGYFDYPGPDLPAQDPTGKTVIDEIKVQ